MEFWAGFAACYLFAALLCWVDLGRFERSGMAPRPLSPGWRLLLAVMWPQTALNLAGLK